MKYLNSLSLNKICSVALAVIIVAANTAIAERHTFETRLNIKGEYSDNINFVSDNPRDDIYYNVGPAITYKYLTERLNLNSTVSFNLIRYSQETDEDRENQNYALGGRYQITERLAFNGRAAYRLDTTQETELLETGEVTAKQDRDRYLGMGMLSWRFSELSKVDLGYNYTQKNFENEDSVDFKRHSISLGYNRYLNNGLDNFSIKPSYDYRDSANSELKNYSFSLGWRHDFSETFFMSLSAGGRYTEQEYLDGSITDNSGYIADIRINRKTETMTTEFAYSRNLHSNVAGGETEVDQFSLNLNRRLLRRLRIGLAGRVYLRRPPGESSNNGRTYYQVSPTLSYRLTEKQNLVLGYSYSNRYDSSDENETIDIDRNAVWFALRLAHDKIW